MTVTNLTALPAELFLKVKNQSREPVGVTVKLLIAGQEFTASTHYGPGDSETSSRFDLRVEDPLALAIELVEKHADADRAALFKMFWGGES